MLARALILVFFILVLLQCTIVLSNDIGVIEKKKRRRSNMLTLDLKYMPALMKTSVLSDDIRIRLSLPGTRNPVCEVKMTNAVDGKFPCQIDKSILHRGANKFDVTIFSRTNGRILARTKTTFYIDAEAIESKQIFSQVADAFSNVGELIAARDLKSLFLLGGAACFVGTFGTVLTRLLSGFVSRSLSGLPMGRGDHHSSSSSSSGDRDSHNNNPPRGGGKKSSGENSSLMSRLGAFRFRGGVPKMAFTSFGRSGATAQQQLVNHDGSIARQESAHSKGIKAVVGLGLGTLFILNAKTALTTIGQSLADRLLSRKDLTPAITVLQQTVEKVGVVVDTANKMLKPEPRFAGSMIGLDLEPVPAPPEPVGPFLSLPSLSESELSRASDPIIFAPSRTELEKQLHHQQQQQTGHRPFTPPTPPTPFDPTLFPQTLRPRFQVDLSPWLQQTGPLQNIIRRLTAVKQHLLGVPNGPLGVVGRPGGLLTPSRFWRTMLAVAVEAAIVVVKLSMRQPYHQAVGAFDMRAPVQYLLRQR